MKTVIRDSKRLGSADQWMIALACPENCVTIDFHGLPAFYTAREGWISQTPPFGQHLLYYCVKGSFRARLKDEDFVVEPGSFVWIPPWTEFRFWLPDERPASFYRLRMKLENLRGESLSRPGAPAVTRGLDSAERWFEEIARAMDQKRAALRMWRVRAALLGLFAEVQWQGTESHQSDQLHSRQRRSLEEWVHRDGRIQVTPAQLARHVGLSADYFARLFRKTYGISPRAWIVRERIKMAAARLLESKLNVGEVAEEFGYQNIFFFSRQFKQVMRQSPMAYRRTTSR